MERSRTVARRAVLLAGVGLVLLGAGATVAIGMRRPTAPEWDGYAIEAAPPLRTGFQRAERVCFADGGRLLAVTCPRYNRVVLYRVEGDDGGPERVADIATSGRAVALQAAADRLYVLQRPAGDARHIEPALWQAYAFDGTPIGGAFRVGWDPDDMALVDDGRTMLVLLSGHAEGESNRPDPSLIVVDLSDPGHPRIRGEVAFDHPGDDPQRLAVREGHARAAVALRGSDAVAWIDLEDPDRPQVVGRTPLPGGGEPGALAFDGAGTLRASDLTTGSAWLLEFGASTPEGAGQLPFDEAVGEVLEVAWPSGRGPVTVGTVPDGSALAVLDPDGRPLGRVRLSGSFGLASVIPMGLAGSASEGGSRIAVADRSGGVHLVGIRRVNPH